MPYPTPAPKLCKCLKTVRNGSLPPELLAPIPGGFVHTCAFKSWKALLAHAKRDKIVIKPTSSVDDHTQVRRRRLVVETWQCTMLNTPKL